MTAGLTGGDVMPSGTWIRSSSGADYVFHPDDEPLPRARGLQTLELSEDGVARRRSPGRDDRLGELIGHWRLRSSGKVEVAIDSSIDSFRLVGGTAEPRLVPEAEAP